MSVSSARRWIVLSLTLIVASATSAQDRPADAWLPEPLSAWLRGLEMIQSGREDAGFEWILKRHRQRPEDPCGYYLAAQGYLNFDLGAPDEEQRNALGRPLLDEGLELDVEDAASRFCRGALYGVRAEQRVVEGGYLGAALDGRKMRRLMLELLEEQPDFVDCKFFLGVYDYYAAVLPKYIKFFRAFLFLPSGDRERGIAELDETTRRGIMERYTAYWVLSGVYDEEGLPDEKRELFRRFHAAYPDDPGAAIARADNLVLAELRQPEAGFEVLAESLKRLEGGEGSEVDAQRVELLYAQGRLHARGYGFERARLALREALALGRDDEQDATRVGVLLIGTLNQSGRHGEAVEVFRDLERSYPEAKRLERLRREAFEYDEASSRLAQLMVPAKQLAWMREFAEAEAEYTKLLREHAAAAQIHLFLAELHFDQELWALAEARFHKVAELAPEKPTFAVPFVQLRLGQICDLTDRRTEAKKHYRLARDSAGDYEGYVRAAEYYLDKQYTGG